MSLEKHYNMQEPRCTEDRIRDRCFFTICHTHLKPVKESFLKHTNKEDLDSLRAKRAQDRVEVASCLAFFETLRDNKSLPETLLPYVNLAIAEDKQLQEELKRLEERASEETNSLEELASVNMSARK